MRIVAMVLACWFLVTLFVSPKIFGKDWNFDIWTTNDVGEVSEALEAPFGVVLDLASFLGTGDDEQRAHFGKKLWDWFMSFSPVNWEMFEDEPNLPSNNHGKEVIE